MDENQEVQEVQSGVEDVSVAGEQEVTEVVESSPVETNAGEVAEVAAPVKNEKDFSAALSAELARREAKLKQQYEERASKADQYQQNLDRIAKFYGYESHDSYLQALEQAETERRIQQEAEKFGVPEDFIRQELQPLKSELETLRQEREKFQQMERMRQVESEVSQLKQKYPDFEAMQDQVFNFAMENGYKLEDSYRLLTYESRIQEAQKRAEQETLAKVTGRDQKQVLPSTDQPNNIQFDPANMSMEEILKLSERVQRGERITF